uniref:Damage-control phosphatase ARMT1-like metal-binding domain-containing protein n=1 Tax=Glycine max TaxID=3847 RepID=A0A0R0HVA1_SOYBN
MQQDVENANAISLFENVVRLNDAIVDEGKRLENLVRGVFARTYLILVIIFVDNSGADIILGIILPFARELLRRGSQVILAANYLPSLNDVTYAELIKIISKLKDEEGRLVGVGTSNLLIANSGNDLPVIDLTRVSQELGNLANDLDLVILEGMGRGIETNLYAQFKCDSLKIAMVEHPEVTEFLGSRFYDCVIKYDEV